MSRYKHIFFDLDRTLWDHEKNAREALEEIFEKHQLNNYIPRVKDFIRQYKKYNEQLWDQYRDGKIEANKLRSERFLKTLRHFEQNDPNLAKKLGEDYLAISPKKTNVIPHTYDVLSYLTKQNYELHILSNGFKETQHQKLQHCRLYPFFDKVITTDQLQGYKKPHPKVFHHALKKTNAPKKKSIYIGDDWQSDILGAKRVGLDHVFFNHSTSKYNGENIFHHNLPETDHQPTFEIKDLRDLKEIF